MIDDIALALEHRDETMLNNLYNNYVKWHKNTFGEDELGGYTRLKTYEEWLHSNQKFIEGDILRRRDKTYLKRVEEGKVRSQVRAGKIAPPEKKKRRRKRKKEVNPMQELADEIEIPPLEEPIEEQCQKCESGVQSMACVHADYNHYVCPYGVLTESKYNPDKPLNDSAKVI